MSTFIQQAKEHLQNSGGRMTSQRRLILQTIESFTGHPTAEEIYNRARQMDANLNLSTVYRTLRWMEENEMINSRQFKDDRRQARFDPTSRADHHHFQCEVCGKIIEFEAEQAEQIKQQFENAYEGRVNSISVFLYGICPDCES
jgi:Fe2+ or Zn2+ uptake regulation protein